MQHYIIRVGNGDSLLSCFLDDIYYKVQRTGENYLYTFLTYCVQGVEKGFATVPYGDIRFFYSGTIPDKPLVHAFIFCPG